MIARGTDDMSAGINSVSFQRKYDRMGNLLCNLMSWQISMDMLNICRVLPMWMETPSEKINFFAYHSPKKITAEENFQVTSEYLEQGGLQCLHWWSSSFGWVHQGLRKQNESKKPRCCGHTLFFAPQGTCQDFISRPNWCVGWCCACGKLCQKEVGAEHKALLLYTLRPMVEKRNDAKLLASDEWCARLTYMANIFQYLNELNTQMQGWKENLLTSTDKINRFCSKVSLWQQHLERATLKMFPLTQKWQGRVNTAALR